MTADYSLAISQLCLRLEQADKLIEWLIPRHTEAGSLQEVLNCVRAAAVIADDLLDGSLNTKSAPRDNHIA